jgi:ribose transport system permease protein
VPETVMSPPPPVHGLLTSSVGHRERRPHTLQSLAIRYAMLWVLVALVIAAQLSYDQFLTVDNLKHLLTQNANVGVVAAGMTLVLIGGGFDLSVSGSFSLGSVLFAGLCVKSGLSVPAALALVLLVGAGCGVVNGLVITRLGVNAFVTTLGTAAAFGGLAAMYSHSEPITVDATPGFGWLGTSSIGGIPIPVLTLVALYLVGSFVLSKTTFGRRLYATGGNEEAARLAGLRVHRIRVVAFGACGITAALAGAMLASTIGTGQTDQLSTVALDSIAAVVIGGTSLFGGEGAMWRTAVGVLILSTLNNLFSSLALEAPLQNLVKGFVVIAAVALETYSRRQRR